MFFLMVCLISCKAKVKTLSKSIEEVNTKTCPEDGTCSYSFLKNKTLLIKTDNLGSDYPEVINGNGSVLKFEYKKHGNSDFQDSGYREEVFIALDSNNLEFLTTDLTNKNLFFARWCYCRGQTGYYKINKGELSISKIDNVNYKLHLSFKIDEVPQIINEINHIFNLD